VKNTCRWVVLSCLILAFSPARAGVVAYDGIGPTDTGSGGGNWFGYLSGFYYTLAQKFTPTVDGALDGLDMTISPDMYSEDRSYTIRLLADNANTPGTVLWETTADTWPVAEDALFHLEIPDGPTISAGQAYWVQADKPEVPNTAHDWDANVEGYKGSFAIYQDSSTGWEVWDNDNVRGLRVTVIPEPGTAGLLLAGTLLLRRLRIRRVAAS